MTIPAQAQERLLAVLTAPPQVQRLWLVGARAMGREQPGSDLDLCLEAPQLSHRDRLRLLNAADDLCLPWQVDLVLRHELPAELGSTCSAWAVASGPSHNDRIFVDAAGDKG